MSVSNSRLNLAEPQETEPHAAMRADRFMANLRQALEHISDVDWLKSNSPLEPFAPRAAPRAERTPTPPTIGLTLLDDRLTAVWQDWETREKTALQQALWQAVRHIQPHKDINYPALLLLTYFQDPRPKQGALIKELALGKSTYYRQLDAAVQALERALVAQMQPSLRLEQPIPRPLIGREDALQRCLVALHNNEVVSIVGAAGLGKTALGATIAQQCLPMFWHTFRPALTDNVQQVLFTIAFFLHQQGASDLWLHLNADPQHVGMSKALGMIRAALESFGSAKPLFCFDEADLLLPRELDEDEAHAQLRSFLEAFITFGAPTLFIGQRVLMEAAPGPIIALDRLNAEQVTLLLQQANLELDEPTRATLLAHTRGNPLLLQLFISLHRASTPTLPLALSSATLTVSLDGVLARLRRHLSTKELNAFDALTVFDTPAPAHAWHSQRKAIDSLVALNLVERHSPDRVAVPPALRETAYKHLPADIRTGLHLAAAHIYADQAEFTHAARHYVLADQPEMAIWTWHTHSDGEIRQGQAMTALNLFEPLRWRALRDVRDRRALALILVRLYGFTGRHDEGIESLDSVDWPRAKRSSSRAKELRAHLLALRGEVEPALASYRSSLDDLRQASLASEALLHAGHAQHLLNHAQDIPAARAEALRASIETERLLGEIEAHVGHLDAAQAHFTKALRLAEPIDDALVMAKLNEHLGLLNIQQGSLAQALVYFDEAEKSYRAYGNLVCAIGVTENNRAFAYMTFAQHEAALPHLRRVIAFSEEANIPHFVAMGHTNLAEALFHLGQLEQAEHHCQLGLRMEDAGVHPQCLYILGHIRRSQGQLDVAERLCREAIAEAEHSGNLWVLEPAREALALVLRDRAAQSS